MPHSRSPRGRRPANTPHSSTGRRSARSFITIALAALSLAACSSSSQKAELSPPTAAEQAYLSNIQFSGARMTASQNFLQHTVTTLHVRVANNGNEPVRYLQVHLTFSTYTGTVSLQRKEQPITEEMAPLKPGETRDIELSFDQLPEDWNQAPPQITPLRVVLGGKS